MTDSITYDKQGRAIAFNGYDAVEVYRAAVLASSIGLWYKSGILPTRGVTGRKMLDMATRYTGKTYTKKTAPQAVIDIGVFVQTMKLALAEEVR